MPQWKTACNKEWKSKYRKNVRKTECVDGEKDCLPNKYKFIKPEIDKILRVSSDAFTILFGLERRKK